MIRLEKTLLLTLSILIGGLNGILNAQNPIDLQQWAENIASDYGAEIDEENITPLIEELLFLAKNPLNINTADREELERIFFLSDKQIENILFQRYVNGPYLSIYELQAVEGLKIETIKYLEPLIFFGPPDKEPSSLTIWGDLFIRGLLQPEKAKGFIPNEEGETPYAGNRLKWLNRLEINTNKGISAGLIAEKDEGEPIFSKEIKTFDLLSGYVYYKPKNSWIKEVGMGRFQMSAGQGLAVQSGIPLRKSSLSLSIRNRQSPFRPSLSTSETSGLNGGFLTLKKENLSFSPFFSIRKRDGRNSSDSCITSLREDGLHRTKTELEQRHNTKEVVSGGRLSYSGKRFKLEAGHLYYNLNHPLCPNKVPYSQFSFEGKQNQNSWISYIITSKNILFFGEAAFDNFSYSAFYNGFTWNAASGFSLAITQRKIPVKYQAPLAGPLTESSKFSGETGIYTGISWELPFFTLSSYFDYFRFDWLQYEIDAPSSGFDWMTHIEKSFGQDRTLYIKFRHREKQKNIVSNNENAITYQNIDQLKGQYRQQLSEQLQFTTLLQWQYISCEDQREEGHLISQDIKWITLQKKLTLTSRYALFSTSNYATRIYAYEPDVLYSLSVPAYAGKGSRFLLLLNYKMTKNAHVWFRWARWHFYDRDIIGSGYQQILSNKKTNLTLQLRIKF
ncbi:ComEA family DNA-binding protein [Thermophagus sp. OGC60D27]|uniref:ComEA family DNA-binding protein n=1 Tax=Thermophagus sp. OGC60D27 TaxID=3458415 RepID=UPI00403841A8